MHFPVIGCTSCERPTYCATYQQRHTNWYAQNNMPIIPSGHSENIGWNKVHHYTPRIRNGWGVITDSLCLSVSNRVRTITSLCYMYMIRFRPYFTHFSSMIDLQIKSHSAVSAHSHTLYMHHTFSWVTLIWSCIELLSMAQGLFSTLTKAKGHTISSGSHCSFNQNKSCQKTTTLAGWQPSLNSSQG